MKKIIDNKLYDTEKATVIFEFIQIYEEGMLLFQEYKYHFRYPAQYLKTQKGTYLFYCKDKNIIEIVNEEKVKKTIMKLDVDKYQELFGKIEEG